jgi:hypothetical protein
VLAECVLKLLQLLELPHVDPNETTARFCDGDSSMSLPSQPTATAMSAGAPSSSIVPPISEVLSHWPKASDIRLPASRACIAGAHVTAARTPPCASSAENN